MKNPFLPGGLVILAFVAAGCGTASTVAEKEREWKAIRAGLDKYLVERSGLNLSTMTIDIREFNTDRDRAQLKVAFVARRGGGTVQVLYDLQREGDVWVVKRARQVSSSPVHPASNEGVTSPPAGTQPRGQPKE